ncbi:hypothetical protein FOMPIDRAFT_1127896 [Fomitopsis schrenkii]|uniref:Hydrophobin n=1 Tax=Fomitopsis schrenkii TaxID=2126942 RepID=S8DXE0_FOMSC|nr:hypothetical protein FOMPIDRAFT_1127896 [Fomitopsis schrenkii]
MPRCSRLAASFLLFLQMLPISASPLSSCYGNSTTLDWYIDAVGETPCTLGATYQKLRQICNSNYQTPSWPINTPTDQCDDPLSSCCCNSVAWSVRMLCIKYVPISPTAMANNVFPGLSCQWDQFGTTDPGHSASTLPESIQLAVCQNGVRLEDFLYSIFWADGSWYSIIILLRTKLILMTSVGTCEYRH